MRIYVAHEYGGDRANIERCGQILKEHQAAFPENCYISPLHNWSYLPYDIIDKQIFMEICYDLLEVCDEVLVLSAESEGVKNEIEMATLLHIPVVYYNEINNQSVKPQSIRDGYVKEYTESNINTYEEREI